MPRKSSRPSRTTQKSPTNFQKDSAPINNNQKPTFGSAVTQGVGIGAGVAIGNTMANAIFGNIKILTKMKIIMIKIHIPIHLIILLK